jgi:hypothetical protein
MQIMERSLSRRIAVARAGVAVLLVSALLSAFSIGCETNIGPVRASGLPPDLTYIPKARVKTAMWVLAAEIGELERILGARSADGSAAAPDRYAARASLERMRVAVSTLQEPGRSTQHPALNQNLGRLIARIERAKRALDRDPPDFFPASSIAGSCALCHGPQKQVAGARMEHSPTGG